MTTYGVQRPMLDATARHGFVGEWLTLIEPQTEADPPALLFQFLAAFGSAVGRNRYVQVEAARHHANLFCCIVGKSSKARKGTSWSWVQRLFESAAPEWLPRLQKGLSTGEGLIHSVRDARGEGDDGIADKRLMVVESEFANVLKKMGREGNTLSATLREAWDGESLQTLTKGTPERATKVHISLVTHITRTELRRLLSATDLSNGLANRFVWVYAERSKLLPEGGALDESSLLTLSSRLARLIDRATTPGVVGRSARARALWREIYPELNQEPVGMHGEATSRAEAQVTRLSLCYALLDGADEIDAEHLEAAHAAWHYITESARFVFGQALANPLAQRIRSLLEDGAMARSHISKALGGHKAKEEIDEALADLASADLAHFVRQKTDGRTVELWRAGPARKAEEAKQPSNAEGAKEAKEAKEAWSQPSSEEWAVVPASGVSL